MADEKKKIEEVRAHARGIHMSPRKVRLVANLLKDMPVEGVLSNLTLMTKKAALPIRKLVNSGVANAKHNFQIDAGRLFVKSLTVDAGAVMKRFKPRAQGRAFPVRRRTSHINLVLGVLDKARPVKRRVAVKTEKAELPETVSSESKSRFDFLRRKRESDPTQVPPKQDAIGKRYTSFNRRAAGE